MPPESLEAEARKQSPSRPTDIAYSVRDTESSHKANARAIIIFTNTFRENDCLQLKYDRGIHTNFNRKYNKKFTYYTPQPLHVFHTTSYLPRAALPPR